MVYESSNDDEKVDARQKVNKQAEKAPNVCKLSIPTIIAALHQVALSKSNAASKNAMITNSALEGDGKDIKLASAGEHIISVIPIDGGKLNKSTAIKLLSEYVQWFVGPDLAKKVNDSTVQSLTEAPGANQKNESKKIISFGQFLLLEANEENTNDDEETKDLEDADELLSDDNEEQKTSNDDSNKKNAEEDIDEKKESKSGYYIAYNLKVEGLPQTALKDSMKKFAKTMFDDLKITFDGLFGGGSSFTVKDVKDAWNNAFGPIDPNDLVDKIDKEISTRYPNKANGINVRVRDKTTLVSELGSNIDAAQKQRINTADYSLWIDVDEDNPTKKIFNPRIIADIVQSSITGIFKKFKNKITKNDVIFIEDYVNTQDDPKTLKNLNISVPEPDDFRKKMKSSKATIGSVWADIDKLIDPILKNPQKKNSIFADECSKAWIKFSIKHEKDKEREKTSCTTDEILEYYDSFLKDYTEQYYKYKHQQNMHESLAILHALTSNDVLKTLVLESMYANKFKLNSFSNFYGKDQIKNDIMSILFEKDADDANSKGVDKDASKDENASINKANAEDKDLEDADALLSGTEQTNSVAAAGDNSKDTENNDERIQTKRNDLYIIPLPGLKYKDKEHEGTYA